MIDLTNKTTEEVNALIQKYADVLQFITPQREVPYFAVVLDIGINYVKEHYSDLSLDSKAWCIVYLKHKYSTRDVKKLEDIPAVIDYFVVVYKRDYYSYVDNIGLYASDYDRDHGFLCKYLK